MVLISKLNLDTLSQRANQIASQDLLNSINGGTENCCHEVEPPPRDTTIDDLVSNS